MPGGIIQLVAVGAQNIHLNGNPSISFFKKVYKTYTNFAIETISLVANKTSLSFNKSTDIIFRVDRNGDLVSSMCLSVKLKALLGSHDNIKTVEHFGEVLLDEAYINIGGTIVDKQYGEWMHIWNELSLTMEKRKGYELLIGHELEGELYPESRIYIPLNFWFSKNPGLAIPLISLQYHEIEVHCKLRPTRELFMVKNTAVNSTWEVPQENGILGQETDVEITLEVDYIFLDTQEREFFAKESQDYLIEQVHRQTFYNIKQNNNLSLQLNNPVKELIWTVKKNNVNLTNEWFSYDDSDNKNVIQSATLVLNGIERFGEKDNVYFNRLQPFQYHTSIPSRGIHTYSFSMYPENFQPSGSCNMSTIHKIELKVKSKSPPIAKTYKYDVDVYAVNYNFLRISGGMAGLAYVTG
jgi:hypothetical protein